MVEVVDASVDADASDSGPSDRGTPNPLTSSTFSTEVESFLHRFELLGSQT